MHDVSRTTLSAGGKSAIQQQQQFITGVNGSPIQNSASIPQYPNQIQMMQFSGALSSTPGNGQTQNYLVNPPSHQQGMIVMDPRVMNSGFPSSQPGQQHHYQNGSMMTMTPQQLTNNGGGVGGGGIQAGMNSTSSFSPPIHFQFPQQQPMFPNQQPLPNQPQQQQQMDQQNPNTRPIQFATSQPTGWNGSQAFNTGQGSYGSAPFQSVTTLNFVNRNGSGNGQSIPSSVGPPKFDGGNTFLQSQQQSTAQIPQYFQPQQQYLQQLGVQQTSDQQNQFMQSNIQQGFQTYNNNQPQQAPQQMQHNMMPQNQSFQQQMQQPSSTNSQLQSQLSQQQSHQPKDPPQLPQNPQQYSSQGSNGLPQSQSTMYFPTQQQQQATIQLQSGSNVPLASVDPLSLIGIDRNSPGPGNSDASSKYRGVSWHKRDRKWLARTWIGRKIEHLGCYRSEDMAALAVDLRTLEHFGNQAKKELNFPNPIHRQQLVQYFTLTGEFRVKTAQDLQATHRRGPNRRKRKSTDDSLESGSIDIEVVQDLAKKKSKQKALPEREGSNKDDTGHQSSEGSRATPSSTQIGSESSVIDNGVSTLGSIGSGSTITTYSQNTSKASSSKSSKSFKPTMKSVPSGVVLQAVQKSKGSTSSSSTDSEDLSAESGLENGSSVIMEESRSSSNRVRKR